MLAEWEGIADTEAGYCCMVDCIVVDYSCVDARAQETVLESSAADGHAVGQEGSASEGFEIAAVMGAVELVALEVELIADAEELARMLVSTPLRIRIHRSGDAVPWEGREDDDCSPTAPPFLLVWRKLCSISLARRCYVPCKIFPKRVGG